MMLLIRDTFHYLFYSIYKEFKNLYPEHLDPVFYSFHAVNGILVILLGPISLALLNPLGITGSEVYITFLALAVIIYVVESMYFKKPKVQEIEKKFKGQNNSKYKKSLIVFFILSVVLWVVMWNWR